MSPTAPLNVTLRGYPEAVLATDTVTLNLPGGRTTAGALARSLAVRSERLAEALLHINGKPRATTKVLVGGTPVGQDATVGAWDAVTVLASLPCDG